MLSMKYGHNICNDTHKITAVDVNKTKDFVSFYYIL